MSRSWFDASFICPECDEEIEFRFKPERPAPACSDHDDPRFSDCGDDFDMEYPDECPNCNEPLVKYEDRMIEATTDGFYNNEREYEREHERDNECWGD